MRDNLLCSFPRGALARYCFLVASKTRLLPFHLTSAPHRNMLLVQEHSATKRSDAGCVFLLAEWQIPRHGGEQLRWVHICLYTEVSYAHELPPPPFQDG